MIIPLLALFKVISMYLKGASLSSQKKSARIRQLIFSFYRWEDWLKWFVEGHRANQGLTQESNSGF